MRRDKVTNDEIEKSHFDILIIKLNTVHKQLSSPVFLYSFNSVEIKSILILFFFIYSISTVSYSKWLANLIIDYFCQS